MQCLLITAAPAVVAVCAGMDKVGIEPSTKSGVAWLTAALLGMLAGGWGLWSTGLLAARLLAGSVWLVAALLLAVLQQGGIVRDADDIKRVQEMTRRQQQQREAAAAAKAAAARQAAAGQAQSAAEQAAGAQATVSVGSASAA
jgi:predicted lipid-binding transport protein (Tim44 family)